MKENFFNGEIPALHSDKEGKLRGGFSVLGGGVDFFSNGGCYDEECGHLNKSCTNTCHGGSGVTNKGCTNNSCAPDSSDNNLGCYNDCKTIDVACSHENKDCTTTVSNIQQRIGISVFSIGTSALF